MEDQRGRRPAVDVLQPTSRQGKAGFREIDDRRGEVQLAGKPRFDRVLVGRDDVQQMAGLQRTDMIGDGFVQ